MSDYDAAGAVWPVGTPDDVRWIRAGTLPGLEITSAIPPIFEAYATVVIPREPLRQASAVLDALRSASLTGPWWLGFLDVGALDRYLPDAPEVELYASWRYRLVQAGPIEALTLRAGDSWKWPLPDLVFPIDRAWLLSTLWDDHWTCIGGSRALVEQLTSHPDLTSRRVELGQDATPPGHTAM